MPGGNCDRKKLRGTAEITDSGKGSPRFKANRGGQSDSNNFLHHRYIIIQDSEAAADGHSLQRFLVQLLFFYGVNMVISSLRRRISAAILIILTVIYVPSRLLGAFETYLNQDRFRPGLIQDHFALSLSGGYIIPFGLPFLAQTDFELRYRTGEYGGILRFISSGDPLYREQQLSATGLWHRFGGGNVGLTINGYRLCIQNYGSGQAYGLDMGFRFLPSKSVRTTVHSANLIRFGNPQIRDSLRPQIRAAVRFLPNTDHAVCLGVNQSPGVPANLIIKIECRLAGSLILMGGFQTSPQEFMGSASLIRNSLSGSAGFAWHGNLGFSTSLRFGCGR